MAISFTIAGYKHPNRLWIRTSTLAVWSDYVEFLLSDKIASYKLDQDGIAIRAAWSTVLNYEHSLRKLACRKILYDGFDFEQALTFAREDLSCKEQYFITPTALLAASRKLPATLQDKGKGKGDKGLSKGEKKRKADAQWWIDNPSGVAAPVVKTGKGKEGKAKGKGRKGKKHFHA